MSSKAFDLISIGLILAAVAIGARPLLTSGDRLQDNDDFLGSLSEYEAIRKSLLEHHQFPLRFHWFGGGYPSLGHPESAALNPLELAPVALGAVRGAKWMAFGAMAIGGASAFWLARYVLRYTRWGSLYCGLAFGTSLFVPVRVRSGNFNEVYAAFFPLCMLLLGFACRRRKAWLLALVFVFYTMLSDGKVTALTVICLLGALCLFHLAPAFRVFGPPDAAGRSASRPLRLLLLALGLTLFLGMARFLPVKDVTAAAGGLANFRYSDHPEMYEAGAGGDLAPPGHGLGEFLGMLAAAPGFPAACFSVGWVPLLLFAIALCAFWREALPWAILVVFFAWLFMGGKAPIIDLYALLRHLPVFNTIRWPDKYFGIPIYCSIMIVSARAFSLLPMLRFRRLEHAAAAALIAAVLIFSVPRMALFMNVYDLPPLPRHVPQEKFFQIRGWNLRRSRVDPPRAQQYFNLRRNIGTIDFQTNIVIGEHAVPKYYVDKENHYLPNPEYRGEVYFLHPGNWAKAELHPDSILIDVVVTRPDTLVVNQNYHPDWRTDHGELFSRDGLLALRLSEKGRYRIKMSYWLKAFYEGLAISGFSLVLLLIFCWAYGTGRWEKWARSGPAWARRPCAAVLWWIGS